MVDIIWGNGNKVLSNDTFEINVTHRKDGNSLNYSDTEKIKITSADIPGLSQNTSEWTKEILERCVKDAFLKCEVQGKDNSGILLSRVSHSGVGGY